MDINKEDSGLRHIWGIKSGADMTGAECGLQTMNDLDITLDIEKERYMLSVETIYSFESKNCEHAYYEDLLWEFTQWMKINNYETDIPLDISEMFNGTSGDFNSIEEAYTYFKLMVDHFNYTYLAENVVTRYEYA